MPESPLCPKCESPVSSNAPHGLCPACLIGGLMVDETMETGADTPDEPAALSAEAAIEQAGERIGRYKLLQQIGEGGFGTVWMAEQMKPVSRRVALKIIKLGMDTKEVIARFEAERQALAMMDHPNIAKVHDAGATATGRPFFVMELVKGIPITKFCDEMQLGTKERLLLFREVCAAINHAHQKGIIHRDIKPSNVLVAFHGDKPVVKVIDFGIAKATQGRLTDKTLFTRFDQFIGTPVYMSPEQAALSGLDIDTRSDIYALGILLYELLTGKPPFDAESLLSAGYDEMRRIIREVEPAKPSSRLNTVIGNERTVLAKARHISPDKLSRLVEPDLDWIVMKALEKNRARRYETANGLALDIQRFLADEPVSATPPGAGYRFRKFARRNRTALRVTAAGAALLLAATAVSTWQAVRATAAEKLATDRLAETKIQRDAKDKALTEAQTARHTAETARQDAEATSSFLGGVFKSPDPLRNGRLITVAEILDTAAKKLATDLASQPERRAQMQSILASSYRALGLHLEAIPLLEKTRDYLSATAGPEHPGTLQAMLKLASPLYVVDRRDEGFKLEETVLEIRRRVNGPEDPDTLTALVRLAESCFYYGRKSEALPLMEQAVTLYRKVKGPGDSQTLYVMGRLAAFYNDRGRGAEATELARQSLKTREELLARTRRERGPEHPDTIYQMRQLVSPYYDTGERDKALALMQEVYRLYRKVNGPENPNSLDTLNDVAFFYHEAGRTKEALPLQAELLALRRKVNGPEHPQTLYAMEWYAMLFASTGKPEEALQLREDMLRIRRKVYGPEHPATQEVMKKVADGYTAAGREAEAKPLREELSVLRASIKAMEKPAPEKKNSQLRSLLDAGLYAEAEPLLIELVAGFPAEGTDGSVELATLQGQLAEVCFRLGKFAQAESFDRRRLQVYLDEADPQDNGTVIRSARRSLGRLLTDWAWAERATRAATAHTHAIEGESILREALDAGQQSSEAGTWRIADGQSRLGAAIFVTAATDKELSPAARETKMAEAEKLLLLGLEGMEQDRSTDLKYKRDGIERFLRFYEAWGKPDKSAEWKSKLEAFDWKQTKNIPHGAILAGSPLRSRFAARAAGTGPEMIDLSNHFNAFFDSEWQGRQYKGNDLSELPAGPQVFAGTAWDVRGIIQLSGKQLPKAVPPWPDKTEGIPVDRKCRRLHFLVSAAYGHKTGETTGTFVLHLADGSEEKRPLVIGKDLLDWWQKPAEGAAGPVVAWSGQNAFSRVLKGSLQLFKVTWENPRPGVEVTSLDFVSEMNDSAPFLIAVTAEP